MKPQRAVLKRVPDSQEPAAPRMRVVPARLPGPIRGRRRRKEVVLRPARPQDASACATLDGRYTTSHVWQLDTRHDGDELRVTFRQVRLPRELALDAPHNPPAARAGALPRGLYWLVAEEMETPPAGVPLPAGPSIAPRGREPQPAPRERALPAPPDTATWNHVVRRSPGASTIQLSLPTQPRSGLAAPSDEGPAPAFVPPAGTIVGYAVVAAGDAGAYLRTLIVDRKRRREGIAGRLLAAAQRWAAAQGADGLMADVPARNYPALRLLQKAGFTFCGFNDRCYADGEVAVFFSCRLP